MVIPITGSFQDTPSELLLKQLEGRQKQQEQYLYQALADITSTESLVAA